jgi:hypothetical protein
VPHRQRTGPVRSGTSTEQRDQKETGITQTDVRPFRVDVPDEALADLRRWVASTRNP